MLLHYHLGAAFPVPQIVRQMDSPHLTTPLQVLSGLFSMVRSLEHTSRGHAYVLLQILLHLKLHACSPVHHKVHALAHLLPEHSCLASLLLT